MLILRFGKSYLWLFAIFSVLLLGSFLLTEDLAAALLPVVMTIVLTSELRSGVVLDSWWRATYLRGSWQYNAGIAIHAIASVYFTWFAFTFIRLA
jgi:hypothetical protein